MLIRANKALWSKDLGIIGRTVRVDSEGYVAGLTDEESARLLQIPGFEDVEPKAEPAIVPEPEFLAEVAEEAAMVEAPEPDPVPAPKAVAEAPKPVKSAKKAGRPKKVK